MLQKAKHAPPPQSYLDKVEKMFAYGVLACDQSGFAPRDGDADLGRSCWYQPAVDYFKHSRSSWTWVHTGGQLGTRPVGDSASIMFPWGGQAVLRNHYQVDGGLWMWMDVGNAYGSSGHAHASKNAINLRYNGTMLLVDSGRFQYNGVGLSEQLNRLVLHFALHLFSAVFQLHLIPSSNCTILIACRNYERTTTAHNTLTFDGCQQAYEPATAKTAVANASWRFTAASDFASGMSSLYDGIEGTVTHQRKKCALSTTCGTVDPKTASVRLSGGTLYTKTSAAGLPPYIVVVDRVTTDRSRTVQASWHAHPNSKVKYHGEGHVATVTGVHTNSGKPAPTMLSIVPSTEFAWKTATVVQGQVGNNSLGLPWQGWYSSTYNGNSSAPTLVYDGTVPKAGAAFGWLLIPQADGSAGLLVASLAINSADANGTVSATVSIGDKQEDVFLALGRAPAPPPPCAANEERICGACKAWPKSLTCPAGEHATLELSPSIFT